MPGKTTIAIGPVGGAMFPFDLAEAEEHSMQAEITDHPVEDGSDISDNIRIKPRELTLTNLVVSNTPTGAIATDPSRQLNGTIPPPATNAYNTILGWFNARQPLMVVTGLQKYPSMGIETVTIPVDAKNYGGLICTIHLKEIVIVQNKRVTQKYPNTSSEQNIGLSLDNLIDGQRVLWRHGAPPGSDPSSVPPGVITQTEVVLAKQQGKASGGHVRYVHEQGGAKLTDAELANFKKDLDREEAQMQNRALYRAQQASNQQDTTAARMQNMGDYKIAHPGAQPDPAQFGLRQGPDGHWSST